MSPLRVVHVKVFSDVELLLGAHHVIEDFEEVEAEVFGGHFGLSFPCLVIAQYITVGRDTPD